MGKFIAEKTVKLLIANERPVKGARVLILGWTFKEDVPDTRNTRVIDILRELQSYGVTVSCFDDEADADEVQHEYGVQLTTDVGATGPHDAVVLAVKHRRLVQRFTPLALAALGGAKPPVIVDVKGFLEPAGAQAAGLVHWRL